MLLQEEGSRQRGSLALPETSCGHCQYGDVGNVITEMWETRIWKCNKF